MKKITAWLLLCGMLLTAAACSEQSENDPASSDGASPNAETAETVPAEEENAEEERLLPDLPDVTYDGGSMRFLSREVVDAVVRFYSEISASEMNGEIMNDSTFERTQRIQEQYDVVIDDQTTGDVAGTFRSCYLAGEDNWEAVSDSFSSALNIANAGYTADLARIDAIDLSKPWWDSGVAEAMMIGGKVFSAVGAMNTWTDSHTYAVVFNKELAGNYGLDLYSMVRENKWTLDAFAGMLEQVTNDVDGNGVMDREDRYGAVGENFNFRLHMLGCDVRLIGHDEEGNLAINVDEKFYTAAERIGAIMSSRDYLRAETLSGVSDPWTNGLRYCFRNGNALLYVGGIEQMLIFRDLDTDIGVLPMPKYDEAQENYAHSFSTYWSSILYVPRNAAAMDMAGVLLEAINADSFYTTSVSYYDVVLKGKAARDQDSCEMIDVIRSSRTIDPEFAYNVIGIDSIYNQALANGTADELASAMAKMSKAAQKKLEQLTKTAMDN